MTLYVTKSQRAAVQALHRQHRRPMAHFYRCALDIILRAQQADDPLMREALALAETYLTMDVEDDRYTLALALHRQVLEAAELRIQAKHRAAQLVDANTKINRAMQLLSHPIDSQE